jgi:hypothetical protein
VPHENRLGCHNAGHLFQRLPAQLLTNLGERLALSVRQAHTTRNLLAEHAILCDQILVAEQQLLVD